eukprot:gene5142-8748_t
MSSEEFKQKGNEALKKGDNKSACEFYSQGLEVDPTNFTLLSNRSAAYLALGDYQKAYEDGEALVNVKPDWSKSYLRKGTALKFLKKYDESSECLSKGLEIEPNNPQLVKTYGQVEQELKKASKKSILKFFWAEGLKSHILDEQAFGPGGLGNVFSDPNIWDKINSNPKLKMLAMQPDYVAMINDLRVNPGAIQKYLPDQRFLTTLGALIGADIKTAEPGDGEVEEMKMDDDLPNRSTEEVKPKEEEEKKQQEVKEEEKPKETPQNVLDAQEEKLKGNALYKKKDFEGAMGHYEKAIELDPKNCIYYLNKAAVLVEQKKYDESIKVCEDAISLGRKERVGFDTIAKCYVRIGNAYLKQENFDKAISSYKEALTEHRTSDTLQKLRDTEKLKKKKEDEAYFSEELSLEEKNKGNELFKKGEAVKAIEHYKEALKRNPKDHSIYHNKAAAYMKLLAFPTAAIDLKKCIDMDPNYIKAYVKLGQCYFKMKEFHNAIKTFNEGLAIEPDNKSLKDGLQLVQKEISNSDYDQERVERAKKDPEIVAILQDPVMQNVLKDLSDPVLAQKHLADPSIYEKINKLIAAGIIQTGKK